MNTITTMNSIVHSPASTKPKHYGMGQDVLKLIIAGLKDKELDVTQVKKWQFIYGPQDAIVLASLDLHADKIEKYQEAVHHISTLVRNKISWAKVRWMNSTGYRIVVSINREQPMPKFLKFPDLQKGVFMLGKDRSSKAVHLRWDKFTQHTIVIGITGSGKSTTLRSMAYQALADGITLMISDTKQVTFTMFENRLGAPIAKTPEDAYLLVKRVIGEMEHRQRLFAGMGGYLENLEEYNEAAIRKGQEPLKRILFIMDEYPETLKQNGGLRGEFFKDFSRLLHLSRSAGIQIVIGAQGANKEDIGEIRDQFDYAICFRTKNADTARILHVAPAATIPPDLPGRAYCDPWGWVQAYYLDKQEMVKGAPGEAVTEDEMKLYKAASGNSGRVTRSLIQKILNVDEGNAKRIQDDLSRRGWIMKDASQQNAFCVTERWKSVVGGSWTQLDGVGAVGRWTENMPENPHPSLPPNEEHV